MARKYSKQTPKTEEQAQLSNGTAVYIRVSTEGQVEEGYSLDAQRAKLMAYCEAHGWHVAPEHVYTDAGITGTSTDKRPAFQDMMQAARLGGVHRIVAVKLDRLARNVRDFLATVDELAAVGCDLVLIQESFDTGTPSGKFALTMFAAMAELEAATITERMMTGKAEKARTGGWNGGKLPFGYRQADDGWSVDEAQASVVRDIYQRFLAGDTMTSIASHLNDTGTATQRGGSWYTTTVRNVLRNGAYAGLRQWDGIETEADALPQIVTPAQYEQAHAKLLKVRTGPPKRA